MLDQARSAQGKSRGQSRIGLCPALIAPDRAHTCQPLASVFRTSALDFPYFSLYIYNIAMNKANTPKVFRRKHPRKSCARARLCANKTTQSSDVTITSSSPSVHLLFLAKSFLPLVITKLCKALLSRQNRQTTTKKSKPLR